MLENRVQAPHTVRVPCRVPVRGAARLAVHADPHAALPYMRPAALRRTRTVRVA